MNAEFNSIWIIMGVASLSLVAGVAIAIAIAVWGMQ